MLKYMLYLVLLIAVVGGLVGIWHLYRVSVRNEKEMAQFAGPIEKFEKDLGKTLVVYYSLSGHTKEIAEIIAADTGADVYEVRTKEKLNTTPWFYMTLRSQLKKGIYPEIESEFPDFSKYDTIFVGAPVWWYTMATPMYSFLKKADFANKAVVPFSTQGSNFGTYYDDFAKNARNAVIKEGQAFNNLPAKYDSNIKNKIVRWLNRLGQK